MNTSLLDGSFNIFNTIRVARFRHKFRKSHPTYFEPDGLLVFVVHKGLEKLCQPFNILKKLLIYIYTQYFAQTYL